VLNCVHLQRKSCTRSNFLRCQLCANTNQIDLFVQNTGPVFLYVPVTGSFCRYRLFLLPFNIPCVWWTTVQNCIWNNYHFLAVSINFPILLPPFTHVIWNSVQNIIDRLKKKLMQILLNNSIPTAKKTQHFSISRINWLISFKEITVVYSENQTKHINTTLISNCFKCRWYIYLPLGF
jgi:hypothetical protein